MYTARPMRQSMSFEVYDFDHCSGKHYIRAIRQGNQDVWSLTKHHELTNNRLRMKEDEVLSIAKELLGDDLAKYKVHQVDFNWEIYK